MTMFLPEHFRDLGQNYVICTVGQAQRQSAPGQPVVERVSGAEARLLLTKLARSEPRMFGRIAEAATGSRPNGYGVRGQSATEALLSRVLRAFGVDSTASVASHGAPRLALLRLTRAPVNATASLTPQARRVRAALARVGTRPVSHRGRTYCFVGSDAVENRMLAQRDAYEALSQQLLLSVLREVVQEPFTAPERKTQFEELLAAIEAQSAASARCDALLLRRHQWHVRKEEAGSDAVTPSQLRKQTHWVELMTLDEDGQPVSGVRVEFDLADGSTSQRATGIDGAARLDGIAPGAVTLRLPDLDGRTWRAAGAQDSGRQTNPFTHVVKRGECLSKIAHAHGLPSWRELWHFSQNAALRKKRKNPNILYQGDKVVVPGKQINQIVRAADASHAVTILAGATVDLVLRLRGDDRQALANEAFELDYMAHGKKTTTPGSLDADGSLTATLPVQAHDVVLRLPALGFACSLTVGGLDPVRNEDDQSVLKSGVKGRLYALGYLSGAEVSDDELKQALSDYQRNEMNKTDATGELDGETLDSLVDTYGA